MTHQLTPEQIQALKAQHPELFQVDVPGTDGERFILFRPATKIEFKRFTSETMNERKRDNASEALVKSVVVFPEGAEREALFERFPGFIDTIANKVAEIAGLEEKVQVKKI